MRIRVYKRRDPARVDGSILSPEGYLWSRPWMVGPTPEDGRPSCWPDWHEAMRYATDPEFRAAYGDADEGGW